MMLVLAVERTAQCKRTRTIRIDGNPHFVGFALLLPFTDLFNLAKVCLAEIRNGRPDPSELRQKKSRHYKMTFPYQVVKAQDREHQI